MDYVFDRIDLTDESEPARARRSGFVQAVRRAFHDGRPDAEFERRWLEHVRTDDAVVAGAWLPEGVFGAGPLPVATISWFDKDLNVGLERLPLRMITDVTASPAHRRRGLTRRLMEDCLADAAAAGLPVVALTVSEATIYGRWGFGVATFSDRIELDTGPRFGLRPGSLGPGRVELVEPPETWPLIRDVFETFHARTRGSVAWPQFYEALHSAAYDFEDGPDKKLRGAVHLTPDETVDGVVLYRYDGKHDGKRTVAITEMVTLTPDAQLALWDFLGSIDLIGRVRFNLAMPGDPLRWALTDFNALSRTGSEEFLWLRVLDVPRTLAARPWSADGEIVVEVTDAQDHAAGRYRIRVRDGRAEVEPTEAPAEIAMDAETLGTLVLGPVSVTTLHGAGRLRGEAEAAARLAAMADLPDLPYCLTGF